MLGQTSISRGQGPQTPTHSKSEVKTKRPCEAKTKKTHSAERDLKNILSFTNQHHKDLLL